MTFCLGIGYVAISIFPDRRSSLGRRPVTHLLPGMITWRHINVTLDDLAFALARHGSTERLDYAKVVIPTSVLAGIQDEHLERRSGNPGATDRTGRAMSSNLAFPEFI